MSAPTPWTEIPAGQDIRLIVCDMDGTLLESDGGVPAEFWPLLAELRSRGVTFVPASGRQYATLLNQFGGPEAGLSYVAENGNLVSHAGEIVSTTTVAPETVTRVIDLVRNRPAEIDAGLVLCGVNSAYVERTGDSFVTEACRYYVALTEVEDLSQVDDEILKLAVYDFASASRSATELFSGLTGTNQVVVSGEHWVDIMDPEVHKGQGVRALQKTLGVTPAQTVAFGDFHNDLEMLDAAQWSFAMANAHPDIHERARYVAPANTEHGVLTVIEHLLDM